MNFFIKITSKSISLSLLGLFLCLSTAAFGQSYSVKDIPNVQLADRTKFTSNPDNILSTTAVAKIDSMLYALKAQGKAQVVVAAVNSIGTESPKNFVHNLLNEWGVGSKGADNGLAILLVLDQGAIEIETGYGLEGDLPDAICKRIINNHMLPSFRQKNWDGGMVAGVRAIYDILNGIEPTGVADNDLNADGSSQIILALVIIGLTIFAPILLLFLASYRRRKCPNCKKHTLKRTNSKIIEKTAKKYVVLETYVCTNCGYVVTRRKTHYNDSSGGSSGGGGPVIFGGGGGSRSGGFGGGFGGGRSGGGGAGGRF